MVPRHEVCEVPPLRFVCWHFALSLSSSFTRLAHSSLFCAIAVVSLQSLPPISSCMHMSRHHERNKGKGATVSHKHPPHRSSQFATVLQVCSAMVCLLCVCSLFLVARVCCGAHGYGAPLAVTQLLFCTTCMFKLAPVNMAPFS